MINKLTFFFICFSFSLSVGAKTFEFNKTQEIPRSFLDIKKVILSVEETCDSGCTYYIEDLVEQRVLNHITDNRIIVWRHFKGLKTIKEYSFVQYNLDKSGKAATIAIHSPTSEQLIELRKRYGLEHNTLFNETKINWYFEKTQDPNTTVVSYNFWGTSNSPWMRIFSKKVYAGLKKSADQAFANFLK